MKQARASRGDARPHPGIDARTVDKMGFPSSSREWFSGPLYERLEVIHHRAFREHGLLRADALANALESHRSGATSHTCSLLAAVQFRLFWTQQA